MKIKKPRLYALIPLISFGTVSGILFTPALPSLSAYFGIDSKRATLTMTLFLLTYAFGQLPYGPLSNRFGRKPTIAIGCLISFVGALLAVLSKPLQSFPFFLFARMLQGLGAAVGLKMAFTIVADYYPPKEGARINSFLVAAFAVVPGVGALFGGMLVESYGWEATFVLLAIYSLIIYALSKTIPETLTEKDHHALKLKRLIISYGKKFKNTRLMLSSTIIGSMTIYSYIFASMAPFFAIKTLGLDPDSYGLCYLIALLGMLCGSFVSARLSRRLTPLQMVPIGLTLSALAAVSMMSIYFLGVFDLMALFVPFFFVLFGVSIAYSNLASYALSTSRNKANASAVMSFINIGLAFVGNLVSGALGAPSPILMGVIFFVISIINLLVYTKLRTLNKVIK